MGLRLGEGLNLTTQDINSSAMQVHIREGKGGKDRLMFIQSAYGLLSQVNSSNIIINDEQIMHTIYHYEDIF